MLLVPIVALAALEGILRLSWPGGALPVFEPVGIAGAQYIVASPRVARRYFANEAMPPAPPVDMFAASKPANGFRVFVLGESTAAGFPYPPNGTFSRVLRDALHDALPSDSVEVVNLGIAATNSFTLVDLAADVIAQKPDAIVIYAGHNEYYGALGIGSTISVGSSPRLVRAYLALERFRTVMVLRNAIGGVTALVHRKAVVDSTAATFMESVARNQQIEVGSRAYNAGLAQFGDNLSRLLRQFGDARVPVFIGSIASNERSQQPFVSTANAPARATFDSAQRAIAGGDTVAARRLFAQARDLDVIRFRAPAALDDTIRAVASRSGAHYVPVAEAIRAASPAGVPGAELFLEHVHPNRHGYALIAQSFFQSIAEARFLGRAAQPARVAPWVEYERRMALSPFDERIVHHTVQTVVTRWPFVSRNRALDYRGTYQPVDFPDSLALLVSRGGIGWADAKLRLGAYEESRNQPELALGEYVGLLRDRPLAEPAYRLVGRTLFAMGKSADALPYLERSLALAPNWESNYLLGVIALGQKDYPKAIALLDRAVTMQPEAVAPVYQLSLAFGLSKNLAAARAAAARAARLDPRYPGLAQWMQALGAQR